MSKHRGKMNAAVVIVVGLAVSWFMSGGYSNKNQIDETTNAPIASPQAEIAADSSQIISAAPAPETASADNSDEKPSETPKKPSETPKKSRNEPVSSPPPVDTKETAASEVEQTCTLTVRCDSILNNISRLDREKIELIPSDGILFKTVKVTFNEGESVFNVLQREMKRAKIHLSFRNTPIYKSSYIEAINNIYEFDCGELSGWMYKVNDKFPSYGSSRYQLKNGDKIEWIYTCDLGRDIGGGDAANAQALGVRE